VIRLVVVGVGTNRIDEHFGGEDVIAHRHKRRLRIIGCSRWFQWLFHETANPAGVLGVNTTERGGLGSRYPDTGHGCAGPVVDVELHHLLGIHPIHVVGAENHYVVRVFVVNQVQGLIDRVGGAGVPARAEALLCRHRGDVLTGQAG
jgi:hypothetical protein